MLACDELAPGGHWLSGSDEQRDREAVQETRPLQLRVRAAGKTTFGDAAYLRRGPGITRIANVVTDTTAIVRWFTRHLGAA